MGMFDYIECKLPLPDGWKPEGPLQTKDFGCEMVCHVIESDGRLMLERIDSVSEVPKAERPYPNEDGLLGLCGSIHQEKSIHDSKFHGVVNFYGSETLGHEEPTPGDTFKRPIYKWHEYNAKFTDGLLVGIDAVPDIS